MELMRVRVSVIHKRVKKKSSGFCVFFCSFLFFFCLWRAGWHFAEDRKRETLTDWERREEILTRERERKALWGATKKKEGKKKNKQKNVDESSVSRAVVVHRRERVGTKAVARGDRRKRRRSFV